MTVEVTDSAHSRSFLSDFVWPLQPKTEDTFESYIITKKLQTKSVKHKS